MSSIPSSKKRVECICPMCRIKHFKRLFLQDAETSPFIYCSTCKPKVGKITGPFVLGGTSSKATFTRTKARHLSK